MRALLTLVTVFCIGVAQAEEAPRGPLPGDVTPTHYALELTILPNQERFSGTVTIDATVETAVDHIWLHGEGLTVEDATVIDARGERLTGQWETIKDTGGVARIGLPRRIAPGPIKIAIRYNGAFSRQLEGFYRADEAGESYVFSQMEPISARQAFPSFDEPRFKTPFDIAVTVREKDVAVSNTPTLREERRDGGQKRVQFATTKPIPTYLVALAVGPLDVVTWEPIAKSAIRDREVPLRGITAKGKGARIRYALANTAGIVRTLEDYFGTPYPYEKLDIIAAIDFSAGAMENAGVIVYREPIILLDDSAALTQKRRYALVHAHELSHQWFGNLVTPGWWNDIWLNEAFASWMGNRATAAWDPNGGYERLTLTEAVGAMDADSWRSVRRIAEPIGSNDDIANAFDDITYDKGGGVLAMFEHYYGADKFRDGVRLYLKRHAWGTATSDDFLNAVAEGTGDPGAPAAFRSFLTQAGVPTVQASATCRAGKATLTLQQSRYVRMPSTARGDQRWSIPLCVAYGDGKERRETCQLVTERRTTVALQSCPSWLLPNAEAAAYARFTLAAKDWDALIAARDSLSDKEIIAAIDSLEAGFTAGTIDVGDYLKRLRALMTRSRAGLPITSDIADLPFWRLIWIKDELVPAAQRPDMERLIHDIYTPWAKQLGLTATSTFDATHPVEAALLRPIVIRAAALQGRDPELRAALKARGTAYLNAGPDANLDPTEASLIEMAMAVAVEDGGAPVVRQIIARLPNERDGTRRQRILSALTQSRDPALTPDIRALAIDPAIRVNEVSMLVNGAMRDPANTAAGWAWFKENFDAAVARIPVLFGRGDLAGVGAVFCTAAQREDYRAFFKPRIDQLIGGPRVFANTLEQIDGCIALVAAQRPKAKAALAVASAP